MTQEFSSQEVANIDNHFEGCLLSKNELESTLETGWHMKYEQARRSKLRESKPCNITLFDSSER